MAGAARGYETRFNHQHFKNRERLESPTCIFGPVTNLAAEAEGPFSEVVLANEEHHWRIRKKLLSQYRGCWVVIHKGQVVASSKDVWEITDTVGKLGFHAYIAKVGEEDIVFKVRGREFAYDQTYHPFALPRAEVTFAHYARTSARLYPDVIPDTGSDLSILREQDCQDIDLFSSPYLPSLTRGVVGASVSVLVYRGNVEINGQRLPSKNRYSNNNG